MRKLVVTENITLDGVIDLAGGWFEPLGTDGRSDLDAVEAEHREAADALLLGRRTFEDFRGFWPQQAADSRGVAGYLDAVHKYVVSSTLEESGWRNSTVLRGPVLDEVRALRAQPGRDIIVTGSMRLVRALVDGGLVDEFRLFVYPLTMGHGTRLFGSGGSSLRLLEARSFNSGVALLRYAAADEPIAAAGE